MHGPTLCSGSSHDIPRVCVCVCCAEVLEVPVAREPPYRLAVSHALCSAGPRRLLLPTVRAGTSMHSTHVVDVTCSGRHM